MKEKENEIDFKYFSLSGFSEAQWYAAIIAVLAVLLIGWTSIMSLLGLNVSLSNIAYLHRYVFVWIFDFVIISLLFLCLFVVNYKEIKLGVLTKQVDDLKSQIDSSIVIAGKIGSGQLSSLPECNQNSELQKTLMRLGKNLMDTKEKESQFSWVTRGKEKISDILRVHNNVEDLAVETLQAMVSYSEAVQGAFFLLEGNELKTITQYAYNRRRYESITIKVGYGLIGAAAYERQIIYRTEIPDDYFTITSGLLGEQKPRTLLIIPLLQEDEVQGVIELAFMRKKLPQHYLSLAEELGKVIGATIYNLKINERTAQLLRESQEMTETLKKNEEQLQQNADEMKEAKLNLEITNSELADKITEVEHGQKRLQALLKNASEFISIYDDNRELTFESPSIRRILGYDDGDTVHGMDEMTLTPKGFKEVTSMFDYLLETPGGEKTLQYTYLKKNGEKIFLETQGKNLLHDQAIRGLIFNTRDVTERIRAEREERMKSRMQSLSENSLDVIIRTGTNGKIAYANPAASYFIGIPTNELIGMKLNEFGEDIIIDLFKTYLTKDSLKIFKKIHNDIVRLQKKQEALQKEEQDLDAADRQELESLKSRSVSEITVEIGGESHVLEVRAIHEFSDTGDELESILFVAHDVTEMKETLKALDEQKQEAEAQKKKVDESINYAYGIQTAIVPKQETFQEHFKNMFMMYFPKNVVSGDFPWFYKCGSVYYMAAVDCTGHGVPGALLSVIGSILLTNIVKTDPELPADAVLEKLHKEVQSTLRQDDESSATGRDGMDLGLCRIDTEKHILQFAGAHRPMYYLHGGTEFEEIKGSKKGIGGIPLKFPDGSFRPEPPFENNIIEYKPGDRFFVFSDGLPDQLDVTRKKKFQTKRFREILDNTIGQDMATIHQEVRKAFLWGWMSDDPTETEEVIRKRQVDDVLLIGVEL